MQNKNIKTLKKLKEINYQYKKTNINLNNKLPIYIL